MNLKKIIRHKEYGYQRFAKNAVVICLDSFINQTLNKIEKISQKNLFKTDKRGLI